MAKRAFCQVLFAVLRLGPVFVTGHTQIFGQLGFLHGLIALGIMIRKVLFILALGGTLVGTQGAYTGW